MFLAFFENLNLKKKLNFFNFGGGGKNFPKFNFLKDLLKIHFKPF